VGQTWKPKASAPREVNKNIYIAILNKDYFMYCFEGSLSSARGMAYSTLNEFYEPPLDAKLDKLLEEK